jgi:serine/threonine-protein kinase
MSEIDAELAAIVQARVGRSVCGGKYTIEGVLGIGGMAAVYAGVHRNGRPVAMKLLHPEFSRRADLRKRFLRESQVANAIQHLGVVQVIDDDVTDDGAAFLVMERLEGKTLEQLWLELGRRFPVRAVLAIARELCEVLAVAHRAGIVHRDLKPENLFLTDDGQLKVLDFGLAQLRDAARPRETQTGMVFGTPAFMPPEQASGQTSKIDARTDVWAVGATMFTLVSGELVHVGETAQHFVVLSAMEPARSLAVAMPHAHPALVALVDRALEREKDRRWQSADAMREAIIETSDMLLGEPETPMMTPTRLLELAQVRGRKRATEPKVATSSDEPTKERVPILNPDDDFSETEADKTRLQQSSFEEVSDVTKPDVLNATSAASSNTPTEKTTPDELPTQVRPPLESVARVAAPDPQKRASWSDLRNAIQGAAPTPRRPYPPTTEAVLDRLPPFDHTAPLNPLVAFRGPPPSRPAFAVPQNRASHPAPVPIAGRPRMTVPTATHKWRLPAGYLPVIGAAILLGFSPLAYVVARDCGATPHEPVVMTSASESARLPTPSDADAPAAAVSNANPLAAPRDGSPTSLEALPVTSATTASSLASPSFSTPPSVSRVRNLPPNPYNPDLPQNPQDSSSAKKPPSLHDFGF